MVVNKLKLTDTIRGKREAMSINSLIKYTTSIGFTDRVLTNSQATVFRHRDEPTLVLTVFFHFQMCTLIFEANYDDPLYQGPISDPLIPDIFQEALTQILD